MILSRFSFTLSPKGEIFNIFHPPDEDNHVLKVKKGFAAMLGSKLHKEDEVRGHGLINVIVKVMTKHTHQLSKVVILG